MIEHVSLPCSNPKKSRDFFVKALTPIGYVQDWVYGDSYAFFHKGHHDFWVVPGEIATPIHLAFNCDKREMVNAFYEAAIAAGGKNNGHPGLRDEESYGKNYYAAYVFDPDGNNIEAVSFEVVKSKPRRRAAKKATNATKARRTRR